MAHARGTTSGFYYDLTGFSQFRAQFLLAASTRFTRRLAFFLFPSVREAYWPLASRPAWPSGLRPLGHALGLGPKGPARTGQVAIQGHLTLIIGLFYSKGASFAGPRFGVEWAEGPFDPHDWPFGPVPLQFTATTDWPTASPSTHFWFLFYCTIEAML